MAEHRIPKEEDFPNNSQGKDRIEPKEKQEIQPIKMKGGVKQKRQLFKTVKEEFISEDAPSIGEYILFDIFFPALKDMILDMSHSAIDIAMGGRGGYSRRRSYSRDWDRDSYISYNRMYDDRKGRRRTYDDDRRPSRRGRMDLDDLVFDYREDAEDCLDRMLDKIEDYGCVSVGYLYDILGRTVYGDFTKEDWGWEDLSQARVRKVRDGYLLDLPRVRPI